MVATVVVSPVSGYPVSCLLSGMPRYIGSLLKENHSMPGMVSLSKRVEASLVYTLNPAPLPPYMTFSTSKGQRLSNNNSNNNNNNNISFSQ